MIAIDAWVVACAVTGSVPSFWGNTHDFIFAQQSAPQSIFCTAGMRNAQLCAGRPIPAERRASVMTKAMVNRLTIRAFIAQTEPLSKELDNHKQAIALYWFGINRPPRGRALRLA
jgi:hypothetical protein